MTPTTAAALLLAAGIALIVAAVAMLAGAAWAMLAAGGLCVALAFLLYDPDPRGERSPLVRRGGA